MARARKRRKSHGRKKAAHCRVVRVNGHNRKMCWNKRGKLVKNTAAHAKRRTRRAKRRSRR